MKLRLLIVFILLSTVLFGQKKKKGVAPTFDLIYGQKVLRKGGFDEQLNSFQNPRLFKPLMYAGIGITGGFVTNSDYDFQGHLHYTQVIPQSIRINDTTYANLTGFNFAGTVAGFDVFKKTWAFDLFLSAGFNTGRLLLYGKNFSNQKNAYFSPKISMTPRLNIGRISFQMNVDYELDLTKKKWRKTLLASPSKEHLPNTSMTGLSVFLMLGYVIE